MLELLKNAWNGWLDFMGAGKMSALFGLSILVCFLLGLGDRKKRELLVYGGITALCCVLPPAAALLMLYQTKFYDYEWIWTLVPLTGVIACAEILFLEWYFGKERKAWRRIIMVAALLMLNCLSGRLGNPDWQVKDLGAERRMVADVLHEIKKDGDGEIVLWAPKEVISNARSLDGEVRLLYGRNLFEEHMNAYSYDVYPAEMRELYVWMVMAGRYGTVVVPVEGDMASPKDDLWIGSTIDGKECMEQALAFGANRILLPGCMTKEALDELARAFSLEWRQVGEYYLFTAGNNGSN